MANSKFRVLLVDDFEPWRTFSKKTFQNESHLQVVGEASDGLEAMQKAQELQPDLILVDIGLPTLNGIEAARRIRKVSPTSKILFVSDNRSAEIAAEALSTGAAGYVVKSNAASELLPAVQDVLAGKRFVGAGLFGRDSDAPSVFQDTAITHSHEVAFYANDASLVDGYARFIESSLIGGNAVIVVLTELHQASLHKKLEAKGVDVPAAMEQGRYIPLDAHDTLTQLTVNGVPDPNRCTKVIGDLIMTAAKHVQRPNGRVAVCGETAPTLLSKGNSEGAILLEHLWDEITRDYRLHTWCGYVSSAFPNHEGDPIFQRICAEHSAVHDVG